MSQYNRNTITKNHAPNFLWAIVYRILTIIFIAISTSSFSQSNFTIEGIVLADNPNPENISDTVIPVNYANIVLLKDTISEKEKNFLVRVQTDENGKFSIPNPNNKANFLQILSLGYSGYYINIKELKDSSFLRIKIQKKKAIKAANVEKPVIYLYPQTETSIEIKLQVKGELATTYPKYNNGWRVIASPNGDLTDSIGNQYSYLFWDGYQNIGSDLLNSNEGFIVKKDSAIYFLETVLPKLNLAAKERNDFIVYWLPVLERNEYCFVSFYTGEKYNSIAEINTIPKADTEIRVFMWIRPIEKPFETKPQVFETIERKGFTLVEWGGSVIHYHNLITKYE
jgi:hypothetical protein